MLNEKQQPDSNLQQTLQLTQLPPSQLKFSLKQKMEEGKERKGKRK